MNGAYCTVEPGISLAELNQKLKSSSKSVPLDYPVTDSISVEDAIQNNCLCLQSMKHGFFNDVEWVRRLGVVMGSGDLIQTGGNKVSDSLSCGLNMTEIVKGSQHQLGMLYEALLNTEPSEGEQEGMELMTTIP